MSRLSKVHRVARAQKLAAARAAGNRAWRERDEAARLAIPPVRYAPCPGDLLHTITVETGGIETVIRAYLPVSAARSDQLAVTVDGEAQDRVMCITSLLALVGRHLPRQPNRRMVRDAEIEDAFLANS